MEPIFNFWERSIPFWYFFEQNRKTRYGLLFNKCVKFYEVELKNISSLFFLRQIIWVSWNEILSSFDLFSWFIIEICNVQRWKKFDLRYLSPNWVTMYKMQQRKTKIWWKTLTKLNIYKLNQSDQKFLPLMQNALKKMKTVVFILFF